MATKLPSLNSQHQRLNILQPKRFNTNHSSSAVTTSNCNDPLGNIGSHLVSASKESQVYSVGNSSLSSIFSLSLGSSSPLMRSTPSPAITTRNRPPNTMAKRNARERNRVKQVNQGFQTLKQHIPDNFRLKKMSKVDTLRCALNYIRNLEKVLDITFAPDSLSDKLKSDNDNTNDFDLDDEDFSNKSDSSPGMSQSQMDAICTSGSGDSGNFIFDTSDVSKMVDLSHHEHGGYAHITEYFPAVNSMMSHNNEENIGNMHTLGHPNELVGTKFKKEVKNQNHFLSSEIM